MGFIGGLLVGKAFAALPLERLGEPATEAATGSFLRRARYARYLLDQRPETRRMA